MTLLSILDGTDVRFPVTWHNYAVPGIPVTMRQLVGGANINTAELVTEEVLAQTRLKPVSCRPSRHGANAQTGKITWIISFLTPVRPFRLFNASELSKPIDKKPAISRHDPGCQGFCNPAKCTRYARCNKCSIRMDLHEGPTGPNCTAEAKCANCHGPFPAGHGNCPAAPKRRNGKTIKPTKKELDLVRRHGDREFRDAQAAVEADTITLSQTPQQTQGLEDNVTTERPKRKRGSIITALTQPSSQSSSQSSSQPPSQPSSSRLQRSTVSCRNLNLASLSAESLIPRDNDEDTRTDELSQENMEIDAPETLC